MREKLIELLDEAEEWADHRCDELECETCPADKMKSNCIQQLMVDRLIANGVRLEEKQATSDETSKWIPVTERLPKPCATEPEWSETVLFRTITGRLYSGYRNQGILPTSFYDDGWYPPYWMDESEQIEVEDEYVTHWMPLPSLPKGE